ncbi:gas vesicle protein GvpO [Streptodolium elevatio]|uniref:Gas vesicle protein GvpO n=1 Tax=Streptodolium elevatio TaxID=3157996 RepID=A0ABV3DWP7_9ACTN
MSAGGPTATQAQWGRILPEWCDQLGYGFDALGVKVRLLATYELLLDPKCKLKEYRRVARFRRGDTGA